MQPVDHFGVLLHAYETVSQGGNELLQKAKGCLDEAAKEEGINENHRKEVGEGAMAQNIIRATKIGFADSLVCLVYKQAQEFVTSGPHLQPGAQHVKTC